MALVHIRIGSHTFCRCAPAIALGLPQEVQAAVMGLQCTHFDEEDAAQTILALRVIGVVNPELVEGECPYVVERVSA